MTSASGLYVGTVSHRRLRPVLHHLRYRAYWLLLDIDELDGTASRLRWFSHNRFNVFSFFDKDHGVGEAAPLRPYVESALREAGLEADGGPIRLFCMPRVLGYGFNPLSVSFCYRKTGELSAILYEVHNTFGERHGYLIPVARPNDPILRQRAEKNLFVSPFNNMQMYYDFRVLPPQDRATIAIAGSDENGTVIAAVLSAKHRPLTDGALVRLLVTHPLVTLKVVSAIHWHALRLWRKGLKVRRRPPPPEDAISVSPVQGPDS